MVERYQRREGINPGSVAEAPKLNPNAVNIPDYGNFLSQLSQFNEKIQDKLDKKTADAALKAGALAGLRADYKPLEGDTIAAEYYNRAGNEIFLNQTLTDTSMRMNQLANDPGLLNDPIAMQGAMSDMRDEIAKNLPLNLIPDFVQQYNNRAVGYITKAQENNLQLIREKNAVTSLQAQQTTYKQMLEAYRAGDVQGGIALREQYEGSVVGQVDLGDTAEGAIAKIKKAKQHAAVQFYVGEGERADPADRATLSVQHLEAMKNTFPPDEYPDAANFYISQMAAVDKMRDAASAQYDDDRKEEARQQAIAIISLKDPAAKMEALRIFEEEAKTNPNISSAELIAAQNAVYNPSAKGNAALASSIERAIIEGKGAEADKMLLDAMKQSELSPDQIDKISARRQEQASGYYDELIKNPEFKRVKDRLDRDYAGQSMGFGQTPPLNKEGQQIYDQVLEKAMEDMRAYKEDPSKGPPAIWSNFERVEKSLKDKKEDAAKGNLKVKVERGGKAKTVPIPREYVDNPAQYEQDIASGAIPKGSDLASIEIKKQMIKLKVDAEEATRQEQAKQSPATPKAPGPQLATVADLPPGDYGERPDGTKKGRGFLGELPNNMGGVSTELSIGVNIDGKETLVPTLVPTLDQSELDLLLAGGKPTKAIADKAARHAVERIKKGLSPFMTDKEWQESGQ